MNGASKRGGGTTSNAREARLKQLAARALAGCRASQNRLFEEYERIVRRAIGNRVPEADLDDLVQRVLLKAHRYSHRVSLDAPVPLEAWLRWLARLELLTTWERRRRRHQRAIRLEGLAKAFPSRPSVEDEYARVDQARRAASLVFGALEALSPEDRQVLRLHHLEDMDFRTVSNRLGIGRGTARVRAFRARKRLAFRLSRSPGFRDATFEHVE